MSTTSSSSIQWSLEQPWLPTVCGVSFLTLAIWWWMGQRTRNPPTSQEPSLSYLLIGSLTVIAGSAYLLRGILEDHYDGAFMVVIGASTFIVCTLIHHFSLCIPIVGVAMLMALVHEHLLHGPEVVRQAQLWWGNQTTTERDDAPKHTLLDTVLSLLPTNTAEAIAPYGFGFAVFLFSFLICQQQVVHMFGRGVALFTIVVTVMFLLLLLVDPVPLTGLHISVLACLPFLLVNTGLPHYLKSGRSKGLTTASVVVVAFMFALASFTGELIFVFGLLISLVLAILLAKFSSLPAVLGPYYNYERRAFVLLNTSFAIVTFRVCSAIENGILSDRIAWFLLAISVGFGFSLCVIAINILGVGSWEPVTAVSHRVAALDFFASVGMFCVGVWVLVTHTETVPWALDIARQHLRISNEQWLKPLLIRVLHTDAVHSLGFDRLHSAWLPCLAAVSIMHLATIVWRSVSRSTSFMAPLISEVRSKSSRYCKKYSLTFNGLPTTENCDELLKLLRKNSVKATFFVDSASAEISGSTLEKVHQDGHEIACLGQAGLHHTSEILEDISRAKSAIKKYLGKSKSHQHKTRANSMGGRSRDEPPDESASWYRPRDGSRDIRVLRAANRAGMVVALWSVCVYDWDASPEDIKRRIENQVHSGGGDIILLHCALPDYLKPPAAANRPPHDVISATKEVISHASANLGQQGVTLTELCSTNGHEV